MSNAIHLLASIISKVARLLEGNRSGIGTWPSWRGGVKSWLGFFRFWGMSWNELDISKLYTYIYIEIQWSKSQKYVGTSEEFEKMNKHMYIYIYLLFIDVLCVRIYIYIVIYGNFGKEIRFLCLSIGAMVQWYLGEAGLLPCDGFGELQIAPQWASRIVSCFWRVTKFKPKSITSWKLLTFLGWWKRDPFKGWKGDLQLIRG